jgi:CHAT domain-containing protein
MIMHRFLPDQLQPTAGRARPHVWWCPTGKLSHLQIHAATSASGTMCSDFVVSSYIPTLGILLHARETYKPLPPESIRMLVASVPRPYSDQWTDLPSTTEELKIVSSISSTPAMRAPSGTSLLVETYHGLQSKDLLNKLPETAILHLACHGLQNPRNALQSGFVLSDTTLTIEKLMSVPLPHAFLAFLSACGTAKGDEVSLNHFQILGLG